MASQVVKEGLLPVVNWQSFEKSSWRAFARGSSLFSWRRSLRRTFVIWVTGVGGEDKPRGWGAMMSDEATVACVRTGKR